VVEVLREEGQKGMHIKQLADRVGMEPTYLSMCKIVRSMLDRR